MRLGLIPEGPLERVALWLGRVPIPLVETHLMFMMARTIMVAADRGVLRCIADEARTAADVAARCGTHPRATEQLLNALAAARYARFDGSRYRLARRVRRWFPGDEASPLLAKLRFQTAEWGYVEHYDRYLETGEPVDMHAAFDEGDWAQYQRAMRDVSRLSAGESARRAPVPAGATALLDLGGAHGLYAAAFCARHRGLRATVLDLPAAVEASSGLLADVPGGDRVEHRVGDLRDAELGDRAWDVVFTSQLAHHFDADANRELTARVFAALRPGGVFVVQDFVRPTRPHELRRAGAGAIFDLYFGATSAAGTHGVDTMQGWMADAGLEPQAPRWLRTLPGAAQIVGAKPRAG